MTYVIFKVLRLGTDVADTSYYDPEPVPIVKTVLGHFLEGLGNLFTREFGFN